jgi:hypothetical protein
MAFISPSFVIFFLMVLLGLRVVPKRRWRSWILLGASLYFYFTWKHVYIFVLAAPIVIDYFC